jgi:hypothetical protein
MEQATTDRSLSRRGMLKLAGAAGAGAGAIGAASGTASAVPTALKGGFAHPALLHTQVADARTQPQSRISWQRAKHMDADTSEGPSATRGPLTPHVVPTACP